MAGGARGKRRWRGRLPAGGEGEREGSLGPGGREAGTILLQEHTRCSLSARTKRKSQQLWGSGGGGGRREPPPAPVLQPLPVNPYSATLLKRGGASGVSPQLRSIQRYHIPVGSLGDMVPSAVGSGRSFLSLPQSLKGKKSPCLFHSFHNGGEEGRVHDILLGKSVN